jgi:hypothetical protein
MRFSLLWTLSFAWLALSSCSDDSTPSTDVSTTKEASATKDTIATVDKGAKKDASAGKDLVITLDGTNPWSCAQIGWCQKGCGTQGPCLTDCKNRGCDSAKTAIDALTQCAVSKCLADCAGGFNDKCMACTSQKCPTEYNACVDHTC